MAPRKIGFKVTKVSSLQGEKLKSQRHEDNRAAKVPSARSGNGCSQAGGWKPKSSKAYTRDVKGGQSTTKKTSDIRSKFRIPIAKARPQKVSSGVSNMPLSPVDLYNEVENAILPPISSTPVSSTARSDTISDYSPNNLSVKLSDRPKGPKCLVTRRSYSLFRNGLYTIFVGTEQQEMDLVNVLETVNHALADQDKFTVVEAKRVIMYMREKLLDSLCVDRITGVDLEGVKLY
ncbi:hypothetical protein BDW02DRAFT_572056 [Decorospora gaudefroyi]|uniref:Uncharacterized protein n=1 Tax=Decorospora gaudefroyi TaxID=184978 RepID=A0A6A5K9J4_9PLEO|nr:hypothetical protein BDW02DRAFT_572056 [Decorospora gaudefroyi]